MTTLVRDLPDVDTADTHALHVLFSPDEPATGRVFRLERGQVFLGRDAPPDGLSFADPHASRRHATISWDPDRERFVLTDGGSRNGTQLNGDEVGVELLAHGDLIRLGDTVMQFAHLDLEVVGWDPPHGCLLKGRSVGLRRVLDDIARVAQTDLSVLVLGESGTGKELVARELHRQSGRNGDFVAVNCAAIPHDLMESELFGFKKGAFTGAQSTQLGLIASARGGTLFLDEVGDLPLALQAKLLRVLDEKRMRPIGATRDEEIDARFIFATNRDLKSAVAEKRFRLDLFARLAEWEIAIPPLRERRSDLLPIVEAMIGKYGDDAPYAITCDFYEGLALHDWPYNVRELVTLVRRAVVRMPEGGRLGLEHLPRPMRGKGLGPDGGDHVGDETIVPPRGTVPTGRELVAMMKHYEGNVAEVARHTARDRAQVYRWLRRHGLQPDAFRS